MHSVGAIAYAPQYDKQHNDTYVGARFIASFFPNANRHPNAKPICVYICTVGKHILGAPLGNTYWVQHWETHIGCRTR